MTSATPQDERILAVIRRPDDLYALSSARTAPFEPPTAGPLTVADPFRHTIVALRDVADDLLPWRDKDVATWEKLGSVPALDAAAGLMIVRIVLATVADPNAEATQQLSGAPPFDLRPALCSDEDVLLAEMRPLLEALVDDANLDLPGWHWKNRDTLRALPAAFRVELLWTLALAPWEHVISAAEAYASLDLDADAPLRRCVAHLFSITPAARALAWCGLVRRVPPHRRAHTVELIIASGACRRAATRDDDDALVRSGVDDDQFRPSVYAALQT
jgi:hypothetical protein